MKNKKRIALLLCFAWGIWASNLWAGKLNDRFQLIPYPQKVEVRPGKGLFYHELAFIVAEKNAEIPVLDEWLDQLPRCKKKGKGITLRLSETDVPESAEGYLLEVTKTGVSVCARSSAGLFYGCQTLAQLMEDSHDRKQAIPFMKITDYPALAYRAVHWDIKLHQSPMEYYYACIDKLARYKVNGIIWELEDKLRYVRRPEIGAPNAISKQEMQAISRYAKERHIEISPLVQGLGHASFILKHHWELREDPQSDWGFCPSDPRTYELQFDLYRDALEALPHGKYLHIGGDETGTLGIDERCRATGKTPFELQMSWLKKVCAFAVENGRVPIFWDDMPLKRGGLWGLFWNKYSEEQLDSLWNTEQLDANIHLFPKECIYMRWNYFDIDEPVNRRVLNWYESKGLKVIGATAAAAGDSPVMPRNESRLKEIGGFNKLAADCHLEGMLTCAWDDGSPHWETVMRGFIAQGEYGWNPSRRSVTEYKVAHAQREFGLAAEENPLAFIDDLEEALFFYDTALVVSGNRNPAYQSGDFRLIDLPDKQNPGAWSEKYADRIEKARQEALRYDRICAASGIALQQALRNRHTLEVYRQINQLQHYPSRLLLALYAYDRAKDPGEREQAGQRLEEVCAYFQEMRAALEKVYSATRFMEQPEGYVADSNHSKNLAARSMNSDWMFLYELPMTIQVKAWLQQP